MSKNVKADKRARRCTILVDLEIYSRAKAQAQSQRVKWYQYINNLLAKDTGLPYPTYLKHNLDEE